MRKSRKWKFREERGAVEERLEKEEEEEKEDENNARLLSNVI